MSQPYEGATGSPRGGQWSASAAGPNRAIAASGEVLRARSRHGYRNSPFLRSAINKGVISEVGRGVTISSICEDEVARATLNQLWKQHQFQLDGWGDTCWGSMLSQIVRARKTAGEVFIRRVPISVTAGVAIPFQLSVLEAEFCPIGLSKPLGGTRRIVQGIEFVGNRKVAAWFHKSHPNDGTLFSADLSGYIRVPMRDLIHHFTPTRPGQVRGEPDTAAALLKDKEFADYSDAELNSKKTRSAFTGFLYRESFGDDDMEFDPQTGKPMFEDAEAPQEEENVAAGTILRGMAGEKLQLFEGDNTGSGFADFVKWQTQQIATALDIPYPLLSGDWSGLSDRTIRAIMNEYRRGVVADQYNVLGFQVCLRVWRWVVDSCVLNGLISAPGFADNPWKYYAMDIRPDAWRHLQPEQDIRASKLAVEAMVSNPEREAAERGTDLLENMKTTARNIREWNEACIAEGIDPATVPLFGVTPPVEETEQP
ncbi:MAG: phage portal protein [Aeromonas sobria]